MFANAKGKHQKQVRQLHCQEQCIYHIPYYLSGLQRAQFFRQPFSKQLLMTVFKNTGANWRECSRHHCGREELETISEAKWRTKIADMYKLALLQNRNGKDVRLTVLIQKPQNNFTLFLIYISQRNLAPHFEQLYKRGLKKCMMINPMHVWDMF